MANITVMEILQRSRMKMILIDDIQKNKRRRIRTIIIGVQGRIEGKPPRTE